MKELITGASSGIGLDMARYLATKGCELILVARNKEKLEYLQRTLPTKSTIIVMDLANEQKVKELYVVAKKENIDILINNAGISHIGLLQDMSIDEWNSSISTNLSSVFFTSKMVIPHMLSKGAGKIINISSVWGVCGASMEVAYSTTKGGINAFTKALAKELAPSNIQVNAIACGAVDTEMNGHLDDYEKEMLINEIPAGRMATPSDVASFVYGIATSNNYLTGQIINFDGGWI